MFNLHNKVEEVDSMELQLKKLFKEQHLQDKQENNKIDVNVYLAFS